MLTRFGAIEINLGAVKTLAVEGGTAHRASSLTWKGLQDALAASYRLTSYSHIRDANTQTGMDQIVQEDAARPLEEELYPYGRDLDEYTAVVRKMVSAYVDVYYATDADIMHDHELSAFYDGLRILQRLDSKSTLVDVITTFIVTVTGIHNQVGNVADYLVNPTFASAKIRPDIQATFQGLNIGLMTSQLTPRLLNDFKHLLLNDEHLSETQRIFDGFQADLRQLSQDIDERNKKRRFPCNSFNPKTMVAAVSI